MIIGIDASRYNTNSPTGVEVYCKHILDNTIPKIKDAKVILYTKKLLPADTKFLHQNNVSQKIISLPFLWTQLGLSSETFQNRPDVLFIPSHVFPVFLGKKNIITIHDVLFCRFKKAYSFFQYYYLYFTTKRAVRVADKIIVPSKQTAEDLQKYFKCPKEKIKIIYHGINHSELKYNFSKEEKKAACDMLRIPLNSKYFSFIGRLETKKNILRIVKAFEMFVKKHPSYYLILAGKPGIGFKEIKKYIDNSFVKKQIILPGYIDNKTKIYLMKYSKLNLLPSLSEGFGIPILESFSIGTPMMTSKLSSTQEIAEDGAILIDPYNIKEMNKEMEKIVKDKEQTKIIIQRGKEIAAKYKWKTAAKETLGVLIDK